MNAPRKKRKPVIDKANDEMVTMEVPIVEHPLPPFRRSHVDIELNRKYAEVLYHLRRTLEEGNHRYAGRRAVQSNNDAIRWLLDRLADRFDERETAPSDTGG